RRRSKLPQPYRRCARRLRTSAHRDWNSITLYNGSRLSPRTAIVRTRACRYSLAHCRVEEMMRMVMRSLVASIALSVFVPVAAQAADHNIRIELNTLEGTETQCRMTFVVENKSAALDSLKLDLVVFNTESVVYRRILTEMGPVRSGRTIV